MVTLQAKECTTTAGDRDVIVLLLNTRYFYLVVCRETSGFGEVETYIIYRALLIKKNRKLSPNFNAESLVRGSKT